MYTYVTYREAGAYSMKKRKLAAVWYPRHDELKVKNLMQSLEKQPLRKGESIAIEFYNDHTFAVQKYRSVVEYILRTDELELRKEAHGKRSK